MKMSLATIFVLLMVPGSFCITLSMVPDAVKLGEDFQLVCNIPSLSGVVQFLKNSVPEGQCTSPTLPIAPGSCDPNIDQDIVTKDTTLNITAASYSHRANWTCTHGGIDQTIYVEIIGEGSVDDNENFLSSDIYASNDPDTELIVYIGCCNPEPTVQWQINECNVVGSTVDVENNPDVSLNSSVTCTSPENAYTSVIKVKDIANPSKSVCYVPKAVISYPPATSSTPRQFSVQIHFEGSLSTCSETKGLCVLVILIIIFVPGAFKGAIYVVLHKKKAWPFRFSGEKPEDSESGIQTSKKQLIVIQHVTVGSATDGVAGILVIIITVPTNLAEYCGLYCSWQTICITLVLSLIVIIACNTLIIIYLMFRNYPDIFQESWTLPIGWTILGVVIMAIPLLIPLLDILLITGIIHFCISGKRRK